MEWDVEVADTHVSALSRERVQRTVRAITDGEVYNPTTATLNWAFLASASARPVEGDWKAGTWDVTPIRAYVAECLIGTGGVTAPGKGRWYAWMRIVDAVANESVVRPVGKLFVS